MMASSKTSEQFVLRLYRLGIQVWEQDGELYYSAPEGVLTEALLAELTERKAEVLKLLRQAVAASAAGDSRIQPVPRDGPLPVSFAQQRLWFLDQLEPNSPAYNIPDAFRLVGALNVTALEQAINEVVRRHEVLRTTFAAVDGEPLQVIAPSLSLPLPVASLEMLDRTEKEPEVLHLAEENAYSPFDLSHGPLLRAQLLRLGGEEHILVLTLHHIVTDGWSIGLFRQELAELYEAFSQGRVSPLADLPVQYADFAIWQRKWLEGGVLAQELAYWRKQLEGASDLTLHTDRPRPALITYEGAYQALVIPARLSSALNALSRQAGVTLFMTLLAAFKVLLYRYTGQENIVVGTPIANRDRVEIEGLIGFFVNTLALRTDLSDAAFGALTFQDLLVRVRETCLGAYANQHVPFEKLVEELHSDRDLSRNPLFQVLFVLQNAPREAMEMAGMMVTPLELPDSKVRFDLEFHLWEEAEEIQGNLIYNTALFDGATMSRMIMHYQTLLWNIAANPQQDIAEIPMLPESERQQILVEWNATQSGHTSAETVVDLFERQVSHNPQAVSCRMHGQELSYKQLNDRSNQVAHFLQLQGIGPDSLVGLCTERSLQGMVGLLGILKAGAAYVPLDPAYPQERLSFMLHDSGVRILLTQSELLNRLPESEVQIVCLDREWEQITQLSSQSPGDRAAPGNLAYVLYTSGSTGTPKGVAMEHRALLNLIAWQLKDSAASEGTRTLQFAPISFDVSFQEIFSTLCSGGTLVLVSEDVRRDPTALLHFLVQESIGRYFTSFTALQQLAQAAQEQAALPGCLREVITAGEQLQTTPQITGLFSKLPDCRLYNHYGPTETHVVTSFPLDASPDGWTGLPPIGRPITNTQIYLLDRNHQPVPIGIPGELYIGGSSLARGYLNRPDLTAERFVPDPFSSKPGARLYRTGDLARYFPDGSIEFIGRTDRQIKIRGYRIEPAEIETLLDQHPAVSQAVVLVKDETPEDSNDATGTSKRLVAYIVPQQTPNPTVSEMRSFLKDRLPEYMLPTAFVFLDALPLTPSGKLNRAALPAPYQNRPDLEEEFAAPRTPVEVKLSEIWANLLKLEKVGIHDDFFELGGHSLLATQVISRTRQAFQVEIPLRSLFEAPTIAGVAELIIKFRTLTQEQVGLIHRTGVMPVARDIPLPASFAQQRLWFLDQLEPNNKAFNIPAAYRLVGSVNVTALEQAINEVVRRHEVLRTTFTAVDGEPLQIIAPSLHVPLPVASLEMLPVAEREAEALRLAVENAYIPFDLSHGPLLRAQLLRLGVEDHILALTLHHIVTDGWSIGVFKQELAELYEAFSQGRESPLVELPVQYADFAVWQRKWLEDGALAEQLAYWRANLEGASDLSLHTDRPRPALISYEGARQRIKFPARLSSALNTLSRRAGVTLFMTLLAAFQVLLYRYTGQEDIVVGTPIANRDRSEIEGLIGFFVNTLVLRTDLSPAASGTLPFQDLLARVRETCLGAYANQHVPFEKLVEELHSERDLSRNPLFQVLFAVQNAPQAAMEMAGTTVTPVELPGGKVRFDLECHLWEEGEEIQGNLIYNTDLFDGATMIRMIAHYQTLLWNIAANPKQGIAEIPILLESEQQQIVVEWNSTGCKYPGDACVHDIYAEQVEQTPERVAVQLGEKRLTYEELNQRANQLAHYLKKLGVGPEVIVGLCIERSLEMVVGLLGILKAGGAYLPLDPTNPPERLLFMLQDARAGVVVTQANLMHKLADCGAKLVCVDRDQEILSRQSAASLPNAASPDSLIYVMYTSGTTGRPKGVAVTHRGVVRLVKGSSYARFDGEVFLQLAPLSFDASTFEIWGALLNGAKLVLMQSEKPSLAELARALREGGVTTLWLTAGLFHVMVEERLEDLGHLHQLLAGGDVLPAPDVAKVVKELPTVRLINGYGPTENTTFSMTYDVFGRAPVPSVPIGRPIANTQAYILDRNMQPVPAGVAGELYLGGAGLARGYLNNPRLTAEKFVPNPYCRAGGARLYRTGDLACYLPDGNIEFLGRTDNQVKLRGFRIELGEIEAVLRMHPLVRDSVILAREDFPGEKRLVAYVVSRDGHQLTNNELRQYLGSKLPEYMLPSATVFLDELPLSFGGKVDRSALEKPGDGDRLAKEAIAVPRDQVERQLVRIWEDVLDVHPIGLKDNFFDLGGHSLLGIRLLARIEKELGKKLPVALLFQSPTVEQLAQAIRGNETLPDWSTIVPIQAGGSKRPFFCVHGFGGGVLGYSELARLLGPEQPFYGLQAIGLSGVEEPDTRIEDMASRYVQAIRSIQPAGPYCLGGYCYGGVVAFEIARQLLDQGELVALLAILEGYALQRVNTIQQLWRPRILARFMLNLPYWLRDLLHEPDGLQKLWSRYRRKPRGNLERREWDDNAERVITESFGDEPDVPESHRRVMAIHLQAIKAYNPQAHSGRVTLFRVRTLSLFRSYDPEMGWGKLATGGVEVKMIAGAHYNFLQQPNVGVLADKLRESLDQAQEHVSHR